MVGLCICVCVSLTGWGTEIKKAATEWAHTKSKFSWKCQCTRQQYFRLKLMVKTCMCRLLLLHLAEGGSPSTLFRWYIVTDNNDNAIATFFLLTVNRDTGNTSHTTEKYCKRFISFSFMFSTIETLCTLQLKCNMIWWRDELFFLIRVDTSVNEYIVAVH